MRSPFRKSLAGLRSGISPIALAAAAPYVPPVEDPVAPPAGDPVPPTDTPVDPGTGQPEPGIDPGFSNPNRNEITDQKQAVARTSTDPGTFGVTYIASEVSGGEYWEFTVSSNTPRGATFAVGIATLALPLNGIPGDRATELAWWSDGTIRQGGATILDLGDAGKMVAGDRGGLWYAADGGLFLSKNCTALNAGAAVGSLVTAAKVYPFAALYSEKTKLTFTFAASKFGCPVPADFYPIGQVPAPASVISGLGTLAHWYDFSDAATVTDDGATISAITDKNGGAANLGNATTSKRPALGNLNSKVAAAFSSDQVLVGSGLNAAMSNEDQPHTLILSMKIDTMPANNFDKFFASFVTSGAAASPRLNHRVTGPDDYGITKTDAAGSTKFGTSNGGADLLPHVVSFVCHGTTLDIRVDGVAVSTGLALNGGAMTGLAIFGLGANVAAADGSSSNNGITATIGEVVLCTSALAAADLDAVEAELAAKWLPA